MVLVDGFPLKDVDYPQSGRPPGRSEKRFDRRGLHRGQGVAGRSDGILSTRSSGGTDWRSTRDTGRPVTTGALQRPGPDLPAPAELRPEDRRVLGDMNGKSTGSASSNRRRSTSRPESSRKRSSEYEKLLGRRIPGFRRQQHHRRPVRPARSERKGGPGLQGRGGRIREARPLFPGPGRLTRRSPRSSPTFRTTAVKLADLYCLQGFAAEAQEGIRSRRPAASEGRQAHRRHSHLRKDRPARQGRSRNRGGSWRPSTTNRASRTRPPSSSTISPTR